MRQLATIPLTPPTAAEEPLPCRNNETAGQSGVIVFTQDGTGGRTVSLSASDYETAGGAGAPADNEPKTGQFRKDEPAQGQQPAQSGATAPAAGGAIPKNIADQLAKLNPEQKKELFQLL